MLHNLVRPGKIPAKVILGAKHRAKKHNREYNLTDEYLYDLYLSQNKKCAITGIDIVFAESHLVAKNTTASIDRIDNSNGYIEGNVRWVHKKINVMKWDLSDKDFIEWCRLTVDNNKSK